jgi:alpha-amylase
MKAERKKHASQSSSGQNGEIPSIHDMVNAKEENLDQYLINDRNPRQSLVDRLLPADTTIEQYYREQYRELYPLAQSVYDVENLSTDDLIKVAFAKEIPVGSSMIVLRKQISLIPGTSELKIEYDLFNTGTQVFECCFGTEFNITLLAGNADNRYYYVDGGNITDRKLNSFGEWGEADSMGMIDEWLNINWRLSWSKKTGFWRFPIETISLSEEGFERVYQNSCIFPFWKISLKPNQRWNVSINMLIKRSV